MLWRYATHISYNTSKRGLGVILRYVQYDTKLAYKLCFKKSFLISSVLKIRIVIKWRTGVRSLSRTAILWIFTQPKVVISYRLFGTTYRTYVKNTEFLTPEDGIDRLSRNVDKKLPLILMLIGPCNANIFAEYNQQDATFHNFFISVRGSTCFRRVFRPSSGAQNCTYSVRYLSDQYCYLLPDASQARSR